MHKYTLTYACKDVHTTYKHKYFSCGRKQQFRTVVHAAYAHTYISTYMHAYRD